MENMLTLIQGKEPTGQTIPRAPDTIDKFQRLNPPTFRGKAGVDPSEVSTSWNKLRRFLFLLDVARRKRLSVPLLCFGMRQTIGGKLCKKLCRTPKDKVRGMLCWNNLKNSFVLSIFPYAKNGEKAGNLWI